MNYTLCTMGLFVVGMLKGMHYEEDISNPIESNLLWQREKCFADREQKLKSIEQTLLGCLDMLNEQKSLCAQLEESIKNDCIVNAIAEHIFPLPFLSSPKKWDFISEEINKK